MWDASGKSHVISMDIEFGAALVIKLLQKLCTSGSRECSSRKYFAQQIGSSRSGGMARDRARPGVERMRDVKRVRQICCGKYVAQCEEDDDHGNYCGGEDVAA